MNDEIALAIPTLESSIELIEMAIRPAARDHILAWDVGQRLVAIHEAGHAVSAAAAPTKIPVRAVDITVRHGGWTSFGGSHEDTSVAWDTKARMLDTMMVACAGASAERLILGEHTNGSETDFDNAAGTAMKFIKSGFGGPEMFIGEDGLPHGYLTEAIRTQTLDRIRELVNDAIVRADALIAEHADALIVVATAVYTHRRLSDDHLSAVLESAGFTLPRPTA